MLGLTSSVQLNANTIPSLVWMKRGWNSSGGSNAQGELLALVIAEPGLFAQLLLEDFDFLLEVLDNILLLAVDPTGQANAEKLKMVHPGRIRVALQLGEKFCSDDAPTFNGPLDPVVSKISNLRKGSDSHDDCEGDP